MLLSAKMLLEYLGEDNIADRIEKAINAVLIRGRSLTPDLGGVASTEEITKAIISSL
jgi:isocitrate/isopropylmalate dehydrogenase